jgi:transcriptional regulator EpsA
MAHPVILSKLEQEYLMGAIEASLRVRDRRGYFLWTQGQLQALLPHRIMLCMQFGADGGLLHAECLHGTVLADQLQARLADPHDGLALRLARSAQAAGVPLALEGDGAQAGVAAELHALGLENVLLHGSGALAGGGTSFALFGMPQRPGPRQAYFMELLLPHLHLALLRLTAGGQAQSAAAAEPPAFSAAGPSRGGTGQRPCSQREMEILHWVREGKSNEEVGQILGISGLTVKNHLQRIYKTLGVSNRTQAVARGLALQLLRSDARSA